MTPRAAYPVGASVTPMRQSAFAMPPRLLERERPSLRSEHLYAGSLSAIALCIALWIRAKTIGEDERGNAERRAMFVGLWPPMFWLIGDTVRRREERRVARPRALVRALRKRCPGRALRR